MNDLCFLKHALFGHLELCTGDQRCLNTFHRAVHGGFMDTPVIAQVRKRTVLTLKFQGHQELLSDAECRWAARFLLPSLSFNQDGLHLGEDLSVLESFFSTLKRELLDGAPFESRALARRAIFEYIEVFYNRRRRHSTLGYLTPLEFERQA